MFNRMKIYTVHIKPNVPRAQEKPSFVREGFNISALILTFLWAFYHRLWRFGLLILAANILIIALGKIQIISPESTGLLQFAVQVLVGFHANDWLRAGMSKRGFIMTDISTGDSLLRAEQRYFERYLQTV
jgi:hypothetical protein